MGLNFSANLSTLFIERPFQERFAAASASGFDAVEFWFPFHHGGEELVRIASDAGVKVVLFNLDPGDTDAGEWGTLGVPNREDHFRHSFNAALRLAEKFGCHVLHTLVGRIPPEITAEACLATARTNLAWAIEQVPAGTTLVVEALNPYDSPAFIISKPAQAAALVREINHTALRVLYDVYHARRVDTNLVSFIHNHVHLIGHVQIADVPGRHQPGTGNMPFDEIFDALETIDYGGYIGLEYHPQGTTEESLSWLNMIRSRENTA